VGANYTVGALSCHVRCSHNPFQSTNSLTLLDDSGLSATIGEPEKFNAWLESVQKAKGFDHKFIHYPHRYSHLRKFAYFPQLLRKDEPFLGLDSDRPTKMIRFIHPVCSLSFAGTMPPDLALETPDLLQLYRALKKQNVVEAKGLDPTVFFSRDTFIRKKDVLRYEADIKGILARLIAAPDALDSSSILQRVVQDIQDPVIMRTSKLQLNSPINPSTFMSGLIHLLSDMKATEGLVCSPTFVRLVASSDTQSSLQFYSILIAMNAR
jgi:ATP-dependent RNA helicase DDX60